MGCYPDFYYPERGFCIFLLSVFQGFFHFLLMLGLPQHLLESNITFPPVHPVFASSSVSKVLPYLCEVAMVSVVHCCDSSLVVMMELIEPGTKQGSSVA